MNLPVLRMALWEPLESASAYSWVHAHSAMSPMQIQTVGFISHLWKKSIFGPFIVIAPLSTLTNWESEFKKWAPSVPVLLYHGSKQERQKMRSSKMPKSKCLHNLTQTKSWLHGLHCSLSGYILVAEETLNLSPDVVQACQGQPLPYFCNLQSWRLLLFLESLLNCQCHHVSRPVSLLASRLPSNSVQQTSGRHRQGSCISVAWMVQAEIRSSLSSSPPLRLCWRMPSSSRSTAGR